MGSKRRRAAEQVATEPKRRSARVAAVEDVKKAQAKLDHGKKASKAKLKGKTVDVPKASEANASQMKYTHFLMKSEPSCFSIDDLEKEPNSTTCWDGVRNAQARNIMKDMEIGNKILFYHSNCKPPGVVGLAEVCQGAYPDYTSWDRKSKAYDPKSTKADPKWFMVDIKLDRKLKRYISLDELKNYKDGPLKDLVLLKRSRLSVQPVSKDDFEFIVGLEDEIVEDKDEACDEKDDVK